MSKPASRLPVYDPLRPSITARIAAELIAHEGIVLEAYKDSVGVWTWSVGVTDASGHRVGRYRDAPQPLSRCLQVYLWLLRTRYMPPVLAAFGDRPPQEHELAAALSFHWNTGAIARAEWMRLFREGDTAAARRSIMNWCRPVQLTERRRCEESLFFGGEWTGNGTAQVYDVKKPGYQPCKPRRVPIIDTLECLIETEARSQAAGPGTAGDAMAPAPATGEAKSDAVTTPAPLPPQAPVSASVSPACAEKPRNWFDRLFS